VDRRPLVIVGTGLGGYSLARDAETPVLILTADGGRYYSKPILSNACTSGKTPDTVALADAAATASQLSPDRYAGHGDRARPGDALDRG